MYVHDQHRTYHQHRTVATTTLTTTNTTTTTDLVHSVVLAVVPSYNYRPPW